MPIPIRDDLLWTGAEFVDVAVVRDVNVITSRTPNDLPEFCLEIFMPPADGGKAIHFESGGG